MSDVGDAGQTQWLAVIGKSLAYLCMREAERQDPAKFDTVLKKVKFLQGMGLTRGEAAVAAGSSAQSVNVLHSRKSRAKNGKAKKVRRKK